MGLLDLILGKKGKGQKEKAAKDKGAADPNESSFDGVIRKLEKDLHKDSVVGSKKDKEKA